MMNILKKPFVKIIDKITIETAPSTYDNISGFDNNESLCNANGYYFLKFTQQTANTAVYELIGNEVIQSWVDIDTELYSQSVVAKIRERYSENEELAILRKAYAGIDKAKFNEYNAYCETCKKEVKLQMIG
jgi:hypothetical protein